MGLGLGFAFCSGVIVPLKLAEIGVYFQDQVDTRNKKTQRIRVPLFKPSSARYSPPSGNQTARFAGTCNTTKRGCLRSTPLPGVLSLKTEGPKAGMCGKAEGPRGLMGKGPFWGANNKTRVSTRAEPGSPGLHAGPARLFSYQNPVAPGWAGQKTKQHPGRPGTGPVSLGFPLKKRAGSGKGTGRTRPLYLPYLVHHNQKFRNRELHRASIPIPFQELFSGIHGASAKQGASQTVGFAARVLTHMQPLLAL